MDKNLFYSWLAVSLRVLSEYVIALFILRKSVVFASNTENKGFSTLLMSALLRSLPFVACGLLSEYNTRIICEVSGVRYASSCCVVSQTMG